MPAAAADGHRSDEEEAERRREKARRKEKKLKKAERAAAEDEAEDTEPRRERGEKEHRRRDRSERRARVEEGAGREGERRVKSKQRRPDGEAEDPGPHGPAAPAASYKAASQQPQESVGPLPSKLSAGVPLANIAAGPAEDTDVGPELPDEVRTRLLRSAGRLEFATKVNEHRFDEITCEDLAALFVVLGGEDQDGAVVVRLSALRAALSESGLLLADAMSEGEVETWLGIFAAGELGAEEIDDDPLVSAGDVLAALQQRRVIGILRMRRTTFRLAQEQENAIQGCAVSKQDLRRHVTEVASRHDAFLTLPFTLLYIIMFMALVQEHFCIYARHRMESSLEAWVNGRDPRTSADNNVDNLDSWWDWALDVGIPSALSTTCNSTDGRFEQYRLASRQTLLGDLRLGCRAAGVEHEGWLLHDASATAHLAAHPGEHLAAARLAARERQDQVCGSHEVDKIWLSFLVYNEFAEAFAITTAHARIDAYGMAEPVVNADAILVRPYGDLQLALIVDVLFLLMVLRNFFGEALDMIASVRLGWDEFVDYWQIWNIVDWCSIVLSFICIGLWVGCVIDYKDETLQGLLDDGRLSVDVMELGADRLDQVYIHFVSMRKTYFALHSASALNAVTIVLKFFKAFQSNPRLKVVTLTFVEAANDLAHFFIIFLTMFLPFCIVGHLLFGNDIEELSSMTASTSTCIALLMGDFGWYVDMAPEHLTHLLPSGMPRVVLFIWFFAFNFIMVLVVLNMLLAVILEHYTHAEGKMQFEVEKPTLWEQVARYMSFRRQTRGFVSLAQISRLLENDDDDPHPAFDVTAESILQAFEKQGVTEKQAQWLMRFLQEKVYLHKAPEQEEDADAAAVGAEVLEVVADNNVQLLEIRATAASIAAGPLDGQLDGLLRGAAKLKQDQQALAKAVNDWHKSRRGG